MAVPHLVLGVKEMDDDHARLEAILARVPDTADAQLPALLDEIAAETRAHFSHEEALMRAADFPVLFCHMAQHKMILDGIEAARGAVTRSDMKGLRNYLAVVLPELIASHVASVDRVTAGFLKGETTAADFVDLRAPGRVA